MNDKFNLDAEYESLMHHSNTSLEEVCPDLYYYS